MRFMLTVLALALLVTPTLAATPDAAPVPPAAVQFTEGLPTPAVSVDLGEACSAPVGGNALPNYCPYDSPACVVHDDCDEYCGSPEFGYCDIQGFFPTGCCLCLG